LRNDCELAAASSLIPVMVKVSPSTWTFICNPCVDFLSCANAASARSLKLWRLPLAFFTSGEARKLRVIYGAGSSIFNKGRTRFWQQTNYHHPHEGHPYKKIRLEFCRFLRPERDFDEFWASLWTRKSENVQRSTFKGVVGGWMLSVER
jgi:hypothetical protein